MAGLLEPGIARTGTVRAAAGTAAAGLTAAVVIETVTALAPLVEIGAAITADRTLGGAVDWAQPGAPSFDDVETEGAAASRAAAIPVTLIFTVVGSPLS